MGQHNADHGIDQFYLHIDIKDTNADKDDRHNDRCQQNPEYQA